VSRIIKSVFTFLGITSLFLILIVGSCAFIYTTKKDAKHEYTKLYSPDRKLILILDNLGKGGSFYVYKNGEIFTHQNKVLTSQVCTNNVFYWRSDTELIVAYDRIEFSDFKSYTSADRHRFRMTLCDRREKDCGEKGKPALRVPYCLWTNQ
jgi:hypothetical protein